MKQMCFLITAMFLSAIILTSCGGGGTSSGTGLNRATTVTGTVKAPNGDPMAGATISIPTGGVATSQSQSVRTLMKATAPDGTTCTDPSQSSCATMCSGANGQFSLSTTGCTGTESQMIIQRGTLKKIIDLNCQGGDSCELSSDEGTFGSGGGSTTYPKVAVVTGTYDRIQDVLAKIAPTAYGTISSTSNELEIGTENKTNLTFIDGNSSLSADYVDFNKYLDGTNSLSSFDVVFINCGATAYENMLTGADAAAVKQRLSDYVNNGGSLYVTDLSYDYVNQTFPGFMNFEGNVNATTPGNLGDAENGTSGLKVDATVGDASMKSWLGNVTVNQHDANTPGNPDVDCSGTYTTRTGALNATGTIPLGDFLSGWARMVGTYDATTKIWVSSGAGVPFDGLNDRPLTVSRNVGSGRIIYTSYHTADTCPTPNFWPQERVLQYLILESF